MTTFLTLLDSCKAPNGNYFLEGKRFYRKYYYNLATSVARRHTPYVCHTQRAQLISIETEDDLQNVQQLGNNVKYIYI